MPLVMNALRLLGIGFVFSMLIAGARADNWERFRGPNGAGVSNDKNIPVKFSAKENVRWKVPVGTGNASPIIWGNRVFIHAASDDAAQRWLACYDTADGKELWKKSIKGSSAKVHALSSYASSTPTTDGETIYVSFWNGKDNIVAAYSFNGDERWSRNLGEFVSQHGAGASPILYKDKLIFANDKDSHYDIKTLKKPVANASKLYALDKKTGNIAWEMPREPYRACYSAPFVLENQGKAPELIVTSTTAITSYDPDTGKPNWNWKWTFSNMPLRTVASTAHVNGTLLACSGDGSGERMMVAVAMNGSGKDARPERLWDNKKDFPYVTGLLPHGDHVYFVNDGGRAGCYTIKTGERAWLETIPDAKFYASPVLIDGKIYACTEQGDVYVIAADPTAFRQIARNPMGERIRATPAVANGALYIRTLTHLVCVGK
jgi:outer membrane protein assembly factor BamB